MQSKRSAGLIAMNAYWFAISYLWNGLGPIILPVLIVAVGVPEGRKDSALGLLTAVGMVVAIIVQPLAGAISDRSTSRWGRRRPFMVAGTLGDMVFLVALALAPQYWMLVVAYVGLQVVSNVAHGPYQGLIPDRVPHEERGAASGIKQSIEITGIIVTSLAVAHLMEIGQTVWAFVSIMAVLLVAVAINTIGVHEEPLREAPQGSLWQALLHTFHVDLRRYAGFVWLVTSRLFIVLAINLVRNYMVYYMQHLFSIADVSEAAGQAGPLTAILAVAIALISYPTGVLADRIGRKPLIVFSGLLGAVGSLLLLLVRSYTGLLVVGGMIGLSIGVFLSANWAMLTDLVPEHEEAARYLGITNLATAGPGLLAGFAGPLVSMFNARSPGQGYVVLYVLAAACYLVGTALMARVREARRAPARGVV